MRPKQRAGEYDEWFRGEGLFAHRDRPRWSDEVAQVVELVGSLTPARTRAARGRYDRLDGDRAGSARPTPPTDTLVKRPPPGAFRSRLRSVSPGGALPVVPGKKTLELQAFFRTASVGKVDRPN